MNNSSKQGSSLTGPLSAKILLPTVVLLSVLAALIYMPVFKAPFVFDDEVYIVKNYRLFSLSNFWPPSGTRYFTYLTFALNHRLGGLDSFGYHVVNVAIHAANSLLVFLLAGLTFKTPLMQRTGRDGAGAALFIAFSSSVLFLVHPVQTGAVAYVTQRFVSLATLFYLLSLVLYVKWRLAEKKGTALYVLSLLFAAMAQKTKEISFTLPAVIVFYEFLFFRGDGLKKRAVSLIPFLLTFFIIPLTLLLPKHEADLSEIAERTMSAQITDLTGISRYAYFATQLRVVVTYLRLLVLPVNQNLDYDYPRFASVLEPQVFLSLLLLLCVIAFAVFIFARSLKKNEPGLALAGFGIFWFFTALSVESSIIPIKDVIFEHRLYLPSAGMIIAFNSLLFYVVSGLKERFASGAGVLTILFVLLFLIAAPLAFASYARNTVWADPIALWSDVARKSPKKVRGHNNLATAYAKAGRVDEALREYKEALRSDPNDLDSHNNLGTVYKDLGLMQEAIKEFKEAVRLNPLYPFAHNNLGAAYYVSGDINGAINEYKEALRLEPGNIETYYNLAAAYEVAGSLNEAIAHYKRFAELAPPEYQAEIEKTRLHIEELKNAARPGKGTRR